MSNYARSDCQVQYGASSALQDPDLDRTLTSTPASPTHYKHVKMTVGTSEETVNLDEFTTIKELYVKNYDPTSYVLAYGRVLIASKTYATNQLGFVDGGAGVADSITDAGSTFLTALRFRAGDHIVITGCTDAAGNNTTMGPVTTAVAGTLTIPTAQVTAEAAEAGLVTIKNHGSFTLRVEGADGGWVKICGVVPGDGLNLISDETSVVEIVVIGT